MIAFKKNRAFCLVIVMIFTCTLIECGESRSIILEHPYKTFCIVGEFNDWENSCENNEYVFQPTSVNDERISKVYNEIKDSTLLYILNVDFTFFEDADWSFKYTFGDKEEELNGALAFKVIRVEREQIDYINYWIPSFESNEVINLTRNQLFLPDYLENDLGRGCWNDNAYVLKKSNYYIILAYQDYHYSIGVIEKEGG